MGIWKHLAVGISCGVRLITLENLSYRLLSVTPKNVAFVENHAKMFHYAQFNYSINSCKEPLNLPLRHSHHQQVKRA